MIQLGATTIDLTRGESRVGGVLHALTPKEAEILKYLAERAETDVPREELYAQVWGHHPASLSRTLDTTIRRLRTKIEPNPSDPRYLRTVHGVGYRLSLGLRSVPPMSVATPEGRDALLPALDALVRQGRVMVVGSPGIGVPELISAWRARPGVDPDALVAGESAGWAGLTYRLGPLDVAATRRILQRRLGREEVEALIPLTDGVPLVIDALARVVEQLGSAEPRLVGPALREALIGEMEPLLRPRWEALEPGARALLALLVAAARPLPLDVALDLEEGPSSLSRLVRLGLVEPDDAGLRLLVHVRVWLEAALPADGAAGARLAGWGVARARLIRGALRRLVHPGDDRVGLELAWAHRARMTAVDRVLVVGALLTLYDLFGDDGRARRLLDEALTLDLEPVCEAELRLLRAQRLSATGSDEVLADCVRAEELAFAAGERELAIVTLGEHAVALQSLGRTDEADALLTRAHALRGALVCPDLVRLAEGRVLALRGRLADAADALRLAHDCAVNSGNVWLARQNLVTLAVVLVEALRFEEARVVLHQITALGPMPAPIAARVTYAHGLMALLLGEDEAARALLSEGAAARGPDDAARAAIALALLALSHGALSEADAALALALRAWPLHCSARLLGQTRTLLGLRHALAGERAAAIELLEESVGGLRRVDPRSGAQAELLLALLLDGEAALARWRDARAWFTATPDPLGERLAAAIGARLGAVREGEPPPPPYARLLRRIVTRVT